MMSLVAHLGAAVACNMQQRVSHPTATASQNNPARCDATQTTCIDSGYHALAQHSHSTAHITPAD